LSSLLGPSQLIWARRNIGYCGAGRLNGEWFEVAHPDQYPLDGAPDTWLVTGGRGSGKTRLGAEWVNGLVRGLPPFTTSGRRYGRIALVGESLGDVREVMIEGPSGIRAIARRERPRFEATRRRLVWETTGAVAQIFSSEDPESLRGPQFDAAWLDELGCPAIDLGPNQPNVFPDPKSSESASPRFSSGGRSDLAQQRFLEAHGRHWDPGDPGFEDDANPVSPVYGGRMVDPSRLYLWSWDARPYPAFPLLRDVWSDGDNWALGHWLNGRLSGISLAGLVRAILRDHGLPMPDIANADGFLTGYVVSDPLSARSALQPLVELFGLDVREDDGRLVFRSPTALATAPMDIADAAVNENSATLEKVRAAAGDLPGSANLSFQDGLRDYQSASARALREGTA
jgi:hypothetical protein